MTPTYLFPPIHHSEGSLPMGCEMETLDGGGGEEERAVAGGSVKACSRAGTFHEMNSIPVTLDWYLLLAVLNFLSYVS